MLENTSHPNKDTLLGQYNWLYRTLLSMSSSTNVKDVLAEIAFTANETLGGQFCVVQPYDEQSDSFLVDQFTMAGDQNLPSFKLSNPRPGGSARYALENEILAINDYDTATQEYPFLIESSAYEKGSFRDIADVKACIGICMGVSTHRLGVLFVNYSAPHYFTDDEKEIARQFSSQAALVIHQARLLENLKQTSEETLNRLIMVMQNILQEALQPDLKQGEFLQKVVDQTLNLLDFTAGWLLLREGDWVKVVATDKSHTNDVGRNFPIHGSLSGLCMIDMKPINIPDRTKAPKEYQRVYQAPQSEPNMMSQLAVPLLVGDEAIGAFTVESKKVAAFDRHAQDRLVLMTNHIAPAVELARLHEEVGALSSLSAVLSQETEMDKIIPLVLKHTLQLANAQFGQVLLHERGKLVVRWTTNDPPNDLNQVVDIQASISGLAVIERRSVIVPDVKERDYYVADFSQETSSWRGNLIQKTTDSKRYKRTLEESKQGMYAEFAVPLRMDDRVIGVVNVETPDRSGFTERQQQDLLSFAETSAAQFAEAVLSGNRTVLQEILRGARAHTSTEFVQILRVDGNDLVIEETTGDEKRGTRVPIERPNSKESSVTGRVVKQNKAEYVPDVAGDPDYKRYLGREMKSEMVVPLIISDQIIGVLNVESPEGEFFRLEHARILEAFARQAAVNIDRARAIETSRMAEIGSLAGDIVHRLNNPLGAIGMRLELLKESPSYSELIDQNPYLEKFLSRVDQELKKAKQIVREIRTEIRGPEPYPVNLLAAVQDGLQQVSTPEHINVSVQVEKSTTVIADNRLVSVFWNLASNAYKAMREPGKLTIKSRVSSDSQWVIIDVTDSGRGIEPWRLGTIFEPDETTTQNSYGPVHGIGLWWVKQRIERYGGTIDISSELGKGTRVILKLPNANLL